MWCPGTDLMSSIVKFFIFVVFDDRLEPVRRGPDERIRRVGYWLVRQTPTLS